MDEHATALAEAIERVLPLWVETSVARVMTAWIGAVPPDVAAAAAEAGRRAEREVGSSVRALLAQDIDDQRTTPLSILRDAVRYPTAVLRAAGVPEIVRDEFQERAFPDDPYDLTPASFADVDPSLGDFGIAWGAAKAMTHLERRRR
jgi:hypothetical protein